MYLIFLGSSAIIGVELRPHSLVYGQAMSEPTPYLRNWFGVLFAIVWNSPLLLLFWYGWSVPLFVWAGISVVTAWGVPAAWRSPAWRARFFAGTTGDDAVPPNILAGARCMWIYAAVSLIGAVLIRAGWIK